MTSLGFCIIHEHDLRVLALAVGLTVFTLLTSSALFRRAGRKWRGATGLWLALGALCVACGVWSVHFVAMLAYLPGATVGFRLGDTILSLAIIITGSLCAFFAAERLPSLATRSLCGVLLGAAVTVMHYVGMNAFEAPGRLIWSPVPVVWSAIFASVLAGLGFAVGLPGPEERQTGRRPAKWRLPVGGALTALGVLLLHFTGMSAIRFQFDPRVMVEAGVISRPLLAVMVTSVAGLALSIGGFTALQDRRDRQRALKRLRLLSASSFEGVALLNANRITDLNLAFAEMTGLERKALAGRPFEGSLFIPDEGQVFQMDGRTEGRLLGAEGRSIPVEVLARAAGAEDSHIVAVRDLTERRQKEQSLSLLFHRNPTPVWVADRGGRVLAVNPAALALYGYDEKGFLALTADQLLPAHERQAVREMVGDLSRYAADRVWRHLRSDGAELLVLPYVEALTFQGRDAYLITVFDVTERERTAQALTLAKEAAEAASLAKSTFLANMSHEIRTPLNGVLGMSQAIAAGELAPVQRQRLEVVLRSGQALLHLLNDLLDVSKIEAGRMELEDIAFDLRAVVSEVELLFRVQAEAKGLAFRADVSPAVASRYRGDPTRLKQVLSNLVSNAVKFTAEGTVAFSAGLEPDGAVRLAVYDTGEGIAADAQERLFESFTQADVSTTRRHGGTGLGLAICRDLVRLMGGEIGVESLEGQGSTFSLVLPLARAEPSEAASPPAVASPAPVSAPAPTEPACLEDGPLGGLELDGGLEAVEAAVRILAAEDNPTNRLVLRTLLAQEGIELTLVENGAEAVDAWRLGAFDILLMDVQMPVMDGPSAVRAIRSEETRLHRPRTPIVAVTANVMSHQLDEYREAGMDGHVAKPIDLATLFATLDEVLGEGEGGDEGASRALAA